MMNVKSHTKNKQQETSALKALGVITPTQNVADDKSLEALTRAQVASI